MHTSPSSTTSSTSLAWFGIDLRWLYADLLPSITRRTTCSHRAGDALHDALIRYAASALHRPIDTPHAYLRRVVDSVLADQFRAEARLSPLPANHDASAPEYDAHAAAAPSAEWLADIRQRLLLMQEVIENLPPRCREVFWLLRVEGCSQPMIAQRLGISVRTVEGHVARALVQLSALHSIFLED